VHALDLPALRAPGIRFWSAWLGAELAGCGALREHSATHAEIKSMRTARAFRGAGVAQAILSHILGVAREAGYTRLSLETGAQSAFEPARRLYARNGFEPCGPFGDYGPDPNSVFMTRSL
jgi:putative acetyltransferase